MSRSTHFKVIHGQVRLSKLSKAWKVRIGTIATSNLLKLSVNSILIIYTRGNLSLGNVGPRIKHEGIVTVTHSLWNCQFTCPHTNSKLKWLNALLLTCYHLGNLPAERKREVWYRRQVREGLVLPVRSPNRVGKTVGHRPLFPRGASFLICFYQISLSADSYYRQHPYVRLQQHSYLGA